MKSGSLRAGYGAIEILRGVDIAVGAGEIVALLGSNGAGKSTLNNNVCGLYRPFGGTIRFEGKRHHRRALDAHRRGRAWSQVPEGRRIFPNLSVRENLELGSYRRGRAARAEESRARRRDLPAPEGALDAARRARCPAASSRCWRSAAA